MTSPRVGQALTIVPFVVLSACGYVGPIKPPTLDIPQHVTDFRAAQFGDKIVAEFTIPALTTEGLPLKDVESAQVAVGIGPNPFTFPAWAATAKKYDVPAAAPGPFTREIPITDWVNKVVVLAVRATGPKGKTSDWSNPVTMSINPPLAKPEELKGQNVRDGIHLTWRGAPTEHFHIYRNSGAESPQQIASSDQPEYLDTSVEFGSEYRYFVDGYAGTLEFSDMAESPPVVREDIFPPSVPAGLTAELGSNAIELSWERNTEPRFQGYNVYRSVNDGPFEKIASLIAAPSYSDRDVQSGKKYRYQVSAVGVNGHESDRSAPNEITAQ